MTDDPILEMKHRFRANFPLFAEGVLKVRTKEGAIVPFALNEAQKRVHGLAELQMREKGKVRILLLKARQLGMSTYVEGRFFWKVIHQVGVRAFILTHHADATANLFGIAKRYHSEAPAFIVPEIGASSQRELAFPKLDSGYKVGTAGTEAIGRSDTIQYFHGSEVAFWPSAETHAAGALQAVPDAYGSEVWLESTANGLGNLFHEMWQDAVRGHSDYLPIFLPWFGDPKYRRDPPRDFTLTADELEYRELYDLDDAQMCWRRSKIAELRSDWLFRQEYPASADEAFQTSGGDTLIDTADVMRARRATVADPVGALVVGVDPADGGADKTGIVRRRGRKAWGAELHDMKAVEVAGYVANLIEEEAPDRVFIDKGGIGSPILGLLHEMGYARVVVGVNFGAAAMDQERYYNLRAEMWGKCAEWLKDAPCELPDSDALHADLCAPQYEWTSSRQIKLETKDQMKKKRGLKSPDLGDALALTFAYPVRGKDAPRDRYRKGSRSGGRISWMAA